VNCSCSACRSNKTIRQIREVAAECELNQTTRQIREVTKITWSEGACSLSFAVA